MSDVVPTHIGYRPIDEYMFLFHEYNNQLIKVWQVRGVKQDNIVHVVYRDEDGDITTKSWLKNTIYMKLNVNFEIRVV